MKQIKRPYKTALPILWFDIKRGCWIGDAGSMRAAIEKGMTKQGGIYFGKQFLSDLFDVAKKEMRPKKPKPTTKDGGVG